MKRRLQMGMIGGNPGSLIRLSGTWADSMHLEIVT